MPVSDPLAEAVALSTDTVVCLRPVDVTGYELMRGEVVSTEGWPQHRIDILIERRYLAAIPVHIPIPSKTRVDGKDRIIIDLANLGTSASVKEVPKPTPTQATRKTTPKKMAKKTSE